MEVWITGGNGFIGSQVCRRALEAGHSVTSVARSGPPPADRHGSWTDEVR